MLRNIRVKVASSVTPIHSPDDLVWKRWLKAPANSTEEFSFSDTELVPAIYFAWPGAGLTDEFEFRINKPALPHRNSFDRFLRVQTTRSRLFHLNAAKSHRLFFSLRQSEIKPPAEFRYNPQVLVFTVYNSRTGVIIPGIIKFKIPQNLPVITGGSVLAGYTAFEDFTFTDFSRPTEITEISLLDYRSESAYVKESGNLLLFSNGSLISRELARMTSEVKSVDLLDVPAVLPQSIIPKYIIGQKEVPTEGYPLRKVSLSDYIRVIKPFMHGLRLSDKGFRVFNVNTFEKCSISRNLVSNVFDNYTYYPAEFPGLNEIRTDYEMPFLSRETIQRFPKVKIGIQDPDQFPVLSNISLNTSAAEESAGDELYDFQNKGINLLVRNPFAILSDEAGMGKTLQAVNALQFLAKRKQIRSALIICSETDAGRKRTTLTDGRPEGWLGHLDTWAPELKAVKLSSDKKKRIKEWNSNAQIFIVSYENLLADEAGEIINSERLNKFDCIIMDSYLSNRFTAYQRDRIFNKLKLRYLWIIDNSPIENYESDIIAYFINTVASAPLHQQQPAGEGIGEFSRRGLLKDLGSDLPLRIFRNKWFELTDEQLKDYTSILEQGQKKLRTSVENGNLLVIRPQIFTILHEILQTLNFPTNGDMSRKASMLVNEAKRITEHGQKCVVLSQYEKYGLKKIEEILTRFDIRFVTYRSGMNSTAMDRVCQEFRERPDIPIFLADVKAINKRINLGSFNQIIHFDQWWNPVSQWAAEDRISSYNEEHVMVQYYRTSNTIEEKIYEMLISKGLLNKLIVESLTQTFLADMITTDEWFEMLELETDGLLTPQNTISHFESALNSVRESSFETIKGLIVNFLVKSGFYKISGTGPVADTESSVIMAAKLINDKEENILIQIMDEHTAGEEEVKSFLSLMSDQKNISRGIIINKGEFAPVCGKYSAVKINLLTLIDIGMLTQYLMHFKLI